MKSYVVCFIFLFLNSNLAQANNTFSILLDDYLNGNPIVVPPGNRNSAYREFTASKYRNVMNLITKKDNVCVIREAAQLYDLDPLVILGSIVGEHTYNVNAWDIAQDTYMYMFKRWVDRFKGNGIDLSSLIAEENYARCLSATDNNYDLWTCYNDIWKSDRRNGRGNDLKWTFFDPRGSGYTYGFGQLGPERALMVTDVVHSVSGFELLTISHPESIYDAILNPQISIHYVAANNRIAIDVYKKYANFDISQNIGIVATLYNLGKEFEKAEALFNRTLDSVSRNETAEYPRVNYYGWFINSKEAEMRETYEAAVQRHCL